MKKVLNTQPLLFSCVFNEALKIQLKICFKALLKLVLHQTYLVGVLAFLFIFASTVFAESSGIKTAQEQVTIHHQLAVQLDPEQHHIEVVDTITLPQSFSNPVTFSLNKALKLSALDEAIHLHEIDPGYYEVMLPNGIKSFKLAYSGEINQPLKAYGKEQSRGFRSTTGIIASHGVFLSRASTWYPIFSVSTKISFDLDINLPKNWKAVSQGAGTIKEKNSHWRETHAQEEIYLIAAPFKVYQQQTGKISAQVYLREADEKLANKYLQATDKYLQMYEKLLGEYPYSKFALVENFWETGYGMPSFTLLGSKVIRLPFILNSSYPHEILHNWWGNGVYVDYPSGNWSEGLTSYLADHLIKEQQNRGVQYRQQSLQKYTDYAARGRDFPLNKFRGRHSSATEAVGYGKTLMLFHMLRQDLGDDLFRQGLQAFYQQFQFQKASYDDIRKVFEKLSNKSLDNFFSQWVMRTGAPALQLDATNFKQTQDAFQLTFTLLQTQSDEAYQLNIPISIKLEGIKEAHQLNILMTQKKQIFQIELPAKPLRLDIDPEFDLFRKLAREETPPAYTRVFGSKQLLVILPQKASDELKKAYQQFAEQMDRMGPDAVSIKWDDELEALPNDKVITLIGWENKFFSRLLPELNKYKVSFSKDGTIINNKTIKQAGSSIALTVRHNKKPLSFIATTLPQALPGLARKLPHYHKYSYLAFMGDEPQNTLKGRWAVSNSPMTAFLQDNAPKPVLKAREALIDPLVLFDSKKMQATVSYMTKAEFKGRGFGSEGLDKVADSIAQAFKKAGLKAGGDKLNSYFQEWQETGGEPKQQVTLKNIIGVIPGVNPKFAGQSVVIGAHYDHLGLGWPDVRADNKGKVHYGADDNASGVAVLLELVRVFGSQYGKNAKPERTLIFIAFSGEEAGRLGSKYYVRSHVKNHVKSYVNNDVKQPSNYPTEKIIGMFNLDTVGRLGKNKFLVLGANSASEWQHIFRGIGFVTGIQTTMVNEELDASDQISFHEAGVPAVQLFSGANLDYHRPSDTADKMDYAGMLKAATISKEIIDYLSSRKEPMTVMLKNASDEKHAKSKTSRKVSLGTVPDFTWTGKGYRLDGVVPDSPVAVAGLKKGDVIIKIANKDINGLRGVSTVLKTLQAGQKISIVFLREGEKIEEDVILNKK